MATVRRPHGRCGPQVDHCEDGADVKQDLLDGADVKQDLQILQVLFAEWVGCKEICRPIQQARRTLCLQQRKEPSANITLVKTHHFIGDITI